MNIIKQYSEVDIDKVMDGKIVEHGGATNTFHQSYLLFLL